MPEVRVVPTVTQPVRIPWGDYAEQALVHETPLIEGAAALGVALAASATGFGGMVASFVGPTVVKQLVDQGLDFIEKSAAGQALVINKPDFLENYVVTTFNQMWPNLFKYLAGGLNPLVQRAISQATPPAPKPYVDSGPVGEAGKKPTGII